MRHYKYIIAFHFVIFTFLVGYSQGNANLLLQKVYNKMQKAKDYSVQANIKVDMPFIRILPVDVKIYFKQPDKFKVESKSIAIVPRQGLDQAQKMLADSSAFTCMVQGEEKLGEIQTSIVNVIPLSDTSEMILGKFWVDPIQDVILKSLLTTRSSGTILTEYTYNTQVEYGLPDKMVFSVDTKKFRMPKNMSTGPNNKDPNKEEKGKDNKKGRIFIVMTNYQVNKGIPDNIFKK
jgi:outer membrane lipoprotein-sorting protein